MWYAHVFISGIRSFVRRGWEIYLYSCDEWIMSSSRRLKSARNFALYRTCHGASSFLRAWEVRARACCLWRDSFADRTGVTCAMSSWLDTLLYQKTPWRVFFWVGFLASQLRSHALSLRAGMMRKSEVTFDLRMLTWLSTYVKAWEKHLNYPRYIFMYFTSLLHMTFSHKECVIGGPSWILRSQFNNLELSFARKARPSVFYQAMLKVRDVGCLQVCWYFLHSAHCKGQERPLVE